MPRSISSFSSRLSAGFSLTLVAALVAAANATAAASNDRTPPDAESPDIEQIIVTASKRDQPLAEFAGAVSLVRDFSGIDNLSDIARRVPGFTVVDAGPRNPAALIIRGLRMDEIDANDLGGDGAVVASYVDNIPLQGYFVPPAFSLKDLQQVEVLRGPQGTLFGNSSVGGFVRYVTAKPDLARFSLKAGAEVSQTAHSDELNYDSDLVINTPLIQDSLGLRLLLGRTDNGGFIDNRYLANGPAEDINDDKTDVARVSLLWQPTDALAINGMVHYQQITVADRQAANESFTGDAYAASSRSLQPMEGTLQLAAVDVEYAASQATTTLSINHYDYAQTERADQTDYFYALDALYYDNNYYTPFENFSAYNKSDVDVVKDSLELRMASADDQPLRWLAGAFYSRDKLDVVIGDHVPGFAEYLGETLPDDLDYLATQTETLAEYSAYGELGYDITPHWDVTLGARFFRYDDDVEVCTTFYPSEGIAACDRDDVLDKNSLGKISTGYKFSEQHYVYATVAQGFRRGGANVLPPESASTRFYNPDEVVNYELGWRSSWLDQRLTLDAALYTVEWTDIQQSMTSDEGYGYTANLGNAQSQGIELDGSWQLTEALKLLAVYNAGQNQTTQAVPSLMVNDGDTLPGSSRSHASLALDMLLPLGPATLDANISYNRTGRVYTALNANYYGYRALGGISTVDARIGVSLGNWHLGAFANNIGDTRGITGARSSEWYGEQGQFDYIIRPRTLGLSCEFHY